MNIEKDEVTFKATLTGEEVKALLFALIIANNRYAEKGSSFSIVDRDDNKLKVSRRIMEREEDILQSLYTNIINS